MGCSRQGNTQSKDPEMGKHLDGMVTDPREVVAEEQGTKCVKRPAGHVL